MTLFLHRKHIAGARFFDVFQGATHTATHARNIPPEGEFEAHARDVGVKSDSHVIVYDSVPGKFGLFLGSRAWWMFRVSEPSDVNMIALHSGGRMGQGVSEMTNVVFHTGS